MNTPTHSLITAPRRAINAIDGAIAGLLAERRELSRGLQASKRDANLPVYDAAREAEIVKGYE